MRKQAVYEHCRCTLPRCWGRHSKAVHFCLSSRPGVLVKTADGNLPNLATLKNHRSPWQRGNATKRMLCSFDFINFRAPLRVLPDEATFAKPSIHRLSVNIVPAEVVGYLDRKTKGLDLCLRCSARLEVMRGFPVVTRHEAHLRHLSDNAISR